MGKVFLCYRREDSGAHAGRVKDWLERDFGADVLFMDVDNIPMGRNFVKVLREEVAKCEVLLAFIGQDWLDVRDEDGNRRLDNPHDFVRIEIAAALQRDIPVVPILLDGAKIPSANRLPKDLEELSFRNGIDLRLSSFRSDVGRLREGLKKELRDPGTTEIKSPKQAREAHPKQVEGKPGSSLAAADTAAADTAAVAEPKTTIEGLTRSRPEAYPIKKPTKGWLTPVVVGIVLLGVIAASVFVYVISLAMKYESGAGMLEQIQQIEAAASKSDDAEKAKKAAAGKADDAEKARQAAEVMAADAEKARQAAEVRAAEAIDALAKSEQARQAAEARVANTDKPRETTEANASTSAAVPVQPALPKGGRDALPKGLDPQNTVFVDTKYGRITIKLRPDLAPKSVERIKQLARDKFYDNVPFHRVIAGFMAQTGDGQYGNGTGGSKYPNLPPEFSSVPFTRGVVAMARASDPNSANSQFFIMYGDALNLNGLYTVVGEVVSGMDVVDKIKKGSDDKYGNVTGPDKITHMQVAADAT
jgi:peptidylprolyl isomerase